MDWLSTDRLPKKATQELQNFVEDPRHQSEPPYTGIRCVAQCSSEPYKFVLTHLSFMKSLNAFNTYYVNKYIDHHAFEIAF